MASLNLRHEVGDCANCPHVQDRFLALLIGVVAGAVSGGLIVGGLAWLAHLI